MRTVVTLTRRELAAYFASPLAYVFVVIFLVFAGGLTFYVGGFIERGQADLVAFFQFHPWLYLFLVPAIGMRLWAEERKTGTIEFLMTLPVSAGQAVAAKFLAAWLFTGLALVGTLPLWVTVSVLGEPDHGVIATAYLGSWLMAGGFLAISACVSAATANQVIAFVGAVALCFVFMMSGLDLVQAAFRGWAPDAVLQAVRDLSLLGNFEALSEGVIDLRNLFYFASLIGLALVINTAIVDMKRGR